MKKQQGATLIAVLIVLVIISILGVTAMRMSLSTLAVAVNSQVGNLLFTASDTGLVAMERTVVNSTQNATGYNGILFTWDIGKKGEPAAETQYCFTPQSAATTTVWTKGSCDLDQTGTNSNYTSKRELVATQVSSAITDFDQVTMGSDTNGLPSYSVKIYSTSVMPAFGSASKADIETCLSKPNDDPDGTVLTVTKCLTQKAAVFETQSSEYVYTYVK